MRECEKLREDLKAYQDGQLPPVQRLAVRMHLSRCAACREEMRAMEQISQEMRERDRGGLDPVLRAKILAAIPDAPPERPSTSVANPLWKRPLVLGGATLATALVMAVLHPLWSSESTPLVSQEMTRAAPANAPTMAMKSSTKGERAMASDSADKSTNGGASAPIPLSQPENKGVLATQGESPSRLAPSPQETTTLSEAAGPQEFTLSVERVEEKATTIEGYAKRAGGFVATQQLTTGDDNRNFATLTLKVPATQVASLLSQVKQLGIPATSATSEVAFLSQKEARADTNGGKQPASIASAQRKAKSAPDANVLHSAKTEKESSELVTVTLLLQEKATLGSTAPTATGSARPKQP